jgi:predicted peptidase
VLDALLDHIVYRYRIDQERIYVTGLSMGGFGTWRLAAQYPDRFAAIAPICGGGDPRDAPRISQLHVWAFHGAKDTIVEPEKSREMVDALKKAGSDVKLTIYPEAGHDSWTKTYNNPELYTWFLEHRRPDKK